MPLAPTLPAGRRRPPAAQALEAVREQLFLRYYKEVPYTLHLELASCRPLDDGSGALRGSGACAGGRGAHQLAAVW